MDDGRSPFLVDRDRDIVQGGVQGIDLRVLEILDANLLVDARAEAKFLRVCASEVQHGREDADHLTLRSLQGVREAAAIQFERVDAGGGVCIRFADLDGAVLEFLR